uniref:MATH domain-containing protein n=1 Tax=Parascaris univalens TaxID=6257 RepID=A0A914ZV08_PARUN
NTAAVNFCKNNRVYCFDEALHRQKDKLIDAKLKERIEAIEKGHQDEENTVDRSALKRAILELTKDNKKIVSLFDVSSGKDATVRLQ